MRNRLLLLLSGLLLLLGSQPMGVCAQDSPAPLSSARQAQLQDLNATDWPTRQAAQRTLLGDAALTDAELDAMYAAATSPEQRQRLCDVALHHLLRRQRSVRDPGAGHGSLGISMSNIANPEPGFSERGAVQVTITFPGFPAFAHLQVGDIIVGIEGRRFDERLSVERSQSYFKERIQKYRPGDEISLMVWREGELLTVQFPTANFEDLGELFNTNRASAGHLPLNDPYQRAWDHRRAQLEAGAPPVPVLSLESGS